MSVTLHTSHGDIKVEIYCESVPKTAEVRQQCQTCNCMHPELTPTRTSSPSAAQATTINPHSTASSQNSWPRQVPPQHRTLPRIPKADAVFGEAHSKTRSDLRCDTALEVCFQWPTRGPGRTDRSSSSHSTRRHIWMGSTLCLDV